MIEKNDLFLWNIFSLFMYIALYKDEKHTLNLKSFFFLVLKEHFYNSNNVIETPLGIALRAHNTFKYLQIFPVISKL